MSINKNDPTLVTSPKLRLSYCHISKPQAPLQEGGDPSYAVTLMIPKDDAGKKFIRELRSAGEAAMENKLGKVVKYKSTIKDADVDENDNGEVYAEKNPEYAGHYILTVRNSRKPAVVDRKRSAIDPDEIYSGCWGAVQVQAFWFDRNAKKGISFSLKVVMKVADGEPFSGGKIELDDFDDFDDEGFDGDDEDLLG